MSCALFLLDIVNKYDHSLPVVNPQTRCAFHNFLLCLRNLPEIFQANIARARAHRGAGSERRSASVTPSKRHTIAIASLTGCPQLITLWTFP